MKIFKVKNKKPKIIYVAGKFQNQPENQKYIENRIKLFIREYPDCIFINGVSSFGYLYSDVDYNTGLDYCLWLLKQADEMWVVGNTKDSIGVKTEIEFAEKHGISIYHKGV